MTETPPRLKLKAQLFCGTEAALGPGKVSLLDAIEQEGSISAAGRLLGMSYRRAWLLVDGMNRCFTDRLVDTTAGGGQNRGARLTAAGREARAAYRQMEADLARAADAEPLAVLRAMLRSAPIDPDATVEAG
ncbi:ModE family transcriptional regulator [Sphingomonas sp. Leaf339]|uniref:winged helix-turn-helix domain-containing protein n=1 Tax=Sphingomonas sp. Leaf339 TaxID=1736343 RepID=UPI0006F3645B|nr:LysR family transcriptional regulator [Sphingomonas sp. Leaf339]KQU53184.1 ModE family transcriptional regulator [Sphingomonas sp. Leaf339]